MGIVIKTDNVATGSYDKLTDKGVVDNLTYVMYSALKEDGYDLSSSEIYALNVLSRRLRIENLLEDVLEIFPFVGENFESRLYKLSGIRSNKMIKVNGINSTENGDLGKGVYFTGRLGNPQSLNTKINVSDFKNGVSFFLYGNLELTSNLQVLLGVGDSLALANSFAFYNTADGKMAINATTSATAGSSVVVNSGFHIYNYNIQAADFVVSNRSASKNGNLSLSNTSTANMSTTSNNSIDLYLGGFNSPTHGAINGLKGSVRCVVITKNINAEKRLVINNIINEFVTYLGK